MKAYCINLDRRPDRLAYIAAAFGRQGLPFERIPAVDGSDPAVAARAARCAAAPDGTRIGTGAFGCFESHREVWRRLVRSGERWGMVFEDDVLLADGVAAYLDDGWVPADADLVKLETYGKRAHLSRGPGLAAGPRRLFRLRSFNKGTGCYVVAAATAARLLEATAAFDVPVDDWLFDMGRPSAAALVTYQMVPAPVVQGDRVPLAQRPDWSRTSITERSAAAGAPAPFRPKSRIGHYRDRLREEGRALVRGTRYAPIPHG